jgi:hypothetical protein
MDAFSFGLGDEAMGGLNGLLSMASGGDFQSGFRDGVRRARNDLAHYRATREGWTNAGAFIGAAGSFVFPGAALGRAAQAGRLGRPIANFLSRGAQRGFAGWRRQALTAGLVGAPMGALYGYGSAEGGMLPGQRGFDNRLANMPLNAAFSGGSAALLGPAINALARIPAHAIGMKIGLGRTPGAPRVNGHTVNALDRAMGAAGDDIAGVAQRINRAPEGARVIEALEMPNAPPSYRAQWQAAGGDLPQGAAQAARLRNTTGDNNLELVRDVLMHNYGSAASNIIRRGRGNFRPLTSIDVAENQGVLDALNAPANSKLTQELIRLLSHRETGRLGRAGPEAVGEGFSNAAFFGDTPILARRENDYERELMDAYGY